MIRSLVYGSMVSMCYYVTVTGADHHFVFRMHHFSHPLNIHFMHHVVVGRDDSRHPKI